MLMNSTMDQNKVTVAIDWITKLANGLPIGANLDYADEMTLTRALDGRIKQ